MSDYETDYESEATESGTSLYDRLTSPDPTAYPQEWADEEAYEEAFEGVRQQDEANEQYEAEYWQKAEDLYRQGVEAGLVGPEADAFFEQRRQQLAEEAHLDYLDMEDDAKAQLAEMFERSARQHNVESAAANGTPQAIGEWLFQMADYNAWRNGDDELRAQLRTEPGVRNVVEAATQLVQPEIIARQRAWEKTPRGFDPNSEKARRDRQEWHEHARRKGIPGAPLW
jgi:hypothetical protein